MGFISVFATVSFFSMLLQRILLGWQEVLFLNYFSITNHKRHEDWKCLHHQLWQVNDSHHNRRERQENQGWIIWFVFDSLECIVAGDYYRSSCSVAQSCPSLYDPMDCSPPGSSCPWTFQLLFSSSRGFSQPRDWTSSLKSPALTGIFFTTSTTWGIHYIS